MRAQVHPGGAGPITDAALRARRRKVMLLRGGLLFSGVLLAGGAFSLMLLSISGPSGVALRRGPPPLPAVAGPTPTRLPRAPFAVDAPTPFEASGISTATVQDPYEADRRASVASAEGRAAAAAAWSDRALRLTRQPQRFTAHALRLAALGETEAAMYWLVRAVDEVGIDPEILTTERALAVLWADPRWDELATWAVERSRYFAAEGTATATVFMPDGSAAEHPAGRRSGRPAKRRSGREANTRPPLAPSPRAVVWLSPEGSDHALVATWAPAIAAATGAPFIALDPPQRVGPQAGRWTGDLLRDRAYVEATLSSLYGGLDNAQQQTVVGSGRSGRVAIDLALRNPSVVSGVLAISPEPSDTDKLDPAVLAIYDRSQTAIVVSGGGQPELAAALRNERGRMVRAGVSATLTIDDIPWTADLPPRLPSRVATWLGALVPDMATPSLPDPEPVTPELPDAPTTASPAADAPPPEPGAVAPASPVLDTKATPAPNAGGEAEPQGAEPAREPDADGDPTGEVSNEGDR